VPGEVLWTWQTSDILLAVCCVGSTLIALDFLLKPLSMAYFMTFMMLPVLEALERRPYSCPGKTLCEEDAPWSRLMPVYEMEEGPEGPTEKLDEKGKPIPVYDDNRNVKLEKRNNPGSDDFFVFTTAEDGSLIRKKDSRGRDIKRPDAWMKEFIMLGKVPHGIACIMTLIISFGTLGGLLSIVASSFGEFSENEDKKAAEGQPTIKSDLYRMGNEFIDDLEVDGIVIIRPRECHKRNITDTKVYSDIRDKLTVQSSNMAYVDDLVDKDQYACKPVNVQTVSTGIEHHLPVRTYNKTTFRCDLDWSKVTNSSLSDAWKVCDLNSLQMSLVDDMLDESTSSLWVIAGAQRNKAEYCMNAFIGDDYRSGDYGAYSLTGDVATQTTVGRSTVGSSRQDVYRALTGLFTAKRFLGELAFGRSGTCTTSNSDALLTDICTTIATGRTGVITGDMIDEACADKTSESVCVNSGYCWFNASWSDTSKSDPVAMPARCIPKRAYRNAFADSTVTVADACGPTPTGAACETQQDNLEKYYLSVLTNMRMDAPPTDMELGVRFYNFTETLLQQPENCSKQNLFRDDPDGQKWEDFLESVGAIVAILNDTVLILLLGVYILMERPQEEPEIRIILEVEAMVKNYINLKVMLSLLTGILVAVMLQACGVQLALVFGLLAFMLNFIPCVGSAIACVLPIPLIVLDDNLSTNEKIVAFCGPASVQLYVGNALEPALFGSSLNLTEISVLNALVLAQLCWGLPGAVLSVPMLGILKIGCHHTEHPMAKYTLSMIRADASVP
jgi:predicted PurR-regulated permease PerM